MFSLRDLVAILLKKSTSPLNLRITNKVSIYKAIIKIHNKRAKI